MFRNFCRGVIYMFVIVEGGPPVLEELWDESGPKRCAIVEKAPTGSYEATLSWIGLSYVGYGGFLFGFFFSGFRSVGTYWWWR